MEKGLLREAGTADAPGNPVLYATTRAFLEKFGLRSTADLPDLDQFAPDDQARAFIRERLSATRTDIAAPSDPEEAMGVVAAAAAAAVGGAADDGAATFAPSADDAAAPGEMPSPFAAALAQGLGVVEKIDFSTLKFETDDE